MSDLIVSFLSSVPKSVLSKFTTPPVTLAVPAAPVGHGRTFYADWLNTVRDGSGNVIPGMYKKAGGTGAIGRVAIFGFSNGVDSGVSQVLEANDAQKIDFVGAFDGIHGSFIGGKLFPSSYNKWIAYAILAAQTKDPNGPQLVVTHSSIEPPTFPSTTETGNLIWNAVLGKIPQDYTSTYFAELDNIVYPGGMTIRSIDTAGTGQQMPSWTWQSFDDGWYVRRNANGFSVFGWGDPGVSTQKRIQAVCRDRFNCTADHIFQADAVLPAILNAYLVNRWNPDCGGTAGFGEGSSCTFAGKSYDAGPSGPLASPFPLGVSLPQTPPTCSYPPPGHVIVGQPGNPCAIEAAPIPPPPTWPGEGIGTGMKWLMGGAGLLGGWAVARAVQRMHR
jgi:hypothetical protein